MGRNEILMFGESNEDDFIELKGKEMKENIQFEIMTFQEPTPTFMADISSFIYEYLVRTEKNDEIFFTQSAERLQTALQIALSDPEKAAEIISQYGDEFGIDKSAVDKFRALNKPEANQPKPTEVAKSDLQSISARYQDKLLQTKNPAEFVQLMNQQYSEMLEFSQNSAVEMIKQTLGEYHKQVVAPKVDFVDRAMTENQKEVSRSSWNSALDSLVSSDSEASKYKDAIRDTLKKDPMWRPYVQLLNTDPKQAAAQGITREALIEKVYQLVSVNDRLAAASKPKLPSSGGLPPTSKHINTANLGGSDWDEIEKNLWSDD